MTNADDTPREELSEHQLRRRASAGLFVVATSGVVNSGIAFLGSLVLARLLTPKDFGLVAVGATVMMLASAIAEGGLGNGLIRRAEPPSRHELQTLVGVQLTFTVVLTAGIVAIALPFGQAGDVTAVMALGLPFSALQAPGRVLLTRKLLYNRLAFVDFGSLIAYYVWAITAVLAGFGVWGMATGTVVKSFASTVLLLALGVGGVIRPSLSRLRSFWPIARFGIKFQAAWLVYVIREQLLNVATAVLGGVAALGLWSLARRLLEIPMLLFQGVWHVSLPAMTHLLAMEIDPRPIIHRTARSAALLAAVILVTLVGATPELIPWLFGEAWRDAALPIPFACLGILISAPVSMATAGYLLAVDRPGSFLGASISSAVTWVLTAIALLPFIGIIALGIGWLTGGIVEALILARAARRESGVNTLRPLVLPLIVAVPSGTIAWFAGQYGDAGLASTIVGAGVGFGASMAGFALLCRKDLMATLGTLAGSIRDAFLVAMRRDSPDALGA